MGSSSPECGGALVSRRHVVTAVVCKGLKRVYLGAHDVWNDERIVGIKIAKETPHPGKMFSLMGSAQKSKVLACC